MTHTPDGYIILYRNGTPRGYTCVTNQGNRYGEKRNRLLSGKTKERSDEEKKDLIHRLNRIEGQIRGIRRMVEEGVYCTDILTQVAAANCAMNSFSKVMLSNHIRTCVARDLKEGNEESVEELVALLQKLMK